MPLEQIICTSCGSTDVVEIKTNTYACRSCETVFKYQDPSHAELEVVPQFCEEGCGNPIKYKCALCGKMVCEGHGEKAKVLLARRYFSSWRREHFQEGTVSELQQAWCLECFENMRDNNMVAYIAEALKDSDRDVRSEAASALGEIGDLSAVPILIAELNNNESTARREVARALGEIGDLSAVPILIAELNNNESTARGEVARALGELGDPSAVHSLGAALKDSNYNVREAAARALGEIGDPSAVPHLMEALKYQYPESAEALERIGDSRGIQAAKKARKKHRKDSQTSWH